jgi:hypothetical protein
MERLRQYTTLQLSLMAAGIFLVLAVGGYFVVTMLTSAKPTTQAPVYVPDVTTLDNKKLNNSLSGLDRPPALPTPQPLQTVNPNVLPGGSNTFGR